MKRLTLAFTGDIMCPPGLTELCTRGGIRDYTAAFAQLRELLSGYDLRIGNLETPIAGAELGFTSERYCFNSPDEFAVMLKEYGFDLLCLANNHCMDRGEIGIDRTLDALDRIGLNHTGIYRSSDPHTPCILEKNCIRVAIVNYTYGTNAFAHHRFLTDKSRVNLFQPEETLPGSIHLLEPMEKIAEETERLYGSAGDEYEKYIRPLLERLRAELCEARQSADFTIAVMHSGGQYNPLPDAYTRLVASKLREFGADCIIGHHPHVIHPCELDGGIFTAYSLGNCYCIPSICRDRIGAAYSALPALTLEKDADGTRLIGCEFSIIKTIEPESGAPCCVNSAALSGEYADEILSFANKFAGGLHEKYNRVEEKYQLF